MFQFDKLTYEAPWCEAVRLEPEYNMLAGASNKDLDNYEDL